MSDLAKKEELAAARATASQIRQGIHNYLATLALIAKANKEQHWRVLGYGDWQSYVDGEFGAERLKLPAEHRQKAVAELRLAGLSTRAIGVAVGVDEKTVRNDLRGAEFSAPDEITGTDGKTYAASRPDRPTPRGEADGQLDRDGVATTAASEVSTDAFTAGASAEAAETSTEVQGGHSVDAVDLDGSTAAGAPTDHGSAGAPVTPDPVADVQAALDRYVPDAEPFRGWNRTYMAEIQHAYRPMSRATAEEVAERADEEVVAELLRVAIGLAKFAEQVKRLRMESLPDNVVPMRGVS